jgi:hypothetical protein
LVVSAITVDLVFGSPYQSLGSNFGSDVLNAVRNALSSRILLFQSNQLQCGFQRSAAIIPNAYSGSDSLSVVTLYIQNASAAAQPTEIKNTLNSLITQNPSAITTYLPVGSPTLTSQFDAYKTCQNGWILGSEGLCPGEDGYSDSSSSNLSSGAIAGIVLGVLAGVAVLVALLYFFMRNRGNKYARSQLDEVDTAGEKDTHAKEYADSEESIVDDDQGIELATTHNPTEDTIDEVSENGNFTHADDDYSGRNTSEEVQDLV